MAEGRYVESKPELYPFLGRLVVEWAELEFFLCQMMRGLLGLAPIYANAVFYSAVNNQTRFELIRRALVASMSGDEGERPAIRKEAEALLAKAQKLNKTRNRFIHGFYIVEPGSGRVTIANMGVLMHDPAKGRVRIAGDYVAWADIKNHCDAVETLATQVHEFTRDRLHLTLP